MRSVSWLFAAKCFTEVPMPCPWMPLTRAEASSPATYGSSEKYSKFRPHNGDRLMFKPGPNRTPTPSARLSSPSARGGRPVGPRLEHQAVAVVRAELRVLLG